MGSKWTGGELGPTGASGDGLSPNTPASDWPPGGGDGFDGGSLSQKVSPTPKSTEAADQPAPMIVPGVKLT